MLIGNSSVGKTSIIDRFTDDKFGVAVATTNSNFKSKSVSLNSNNIVTLNIWDTAGQERYRSISQMFYRKGNVFLIVCDLSCENLCDDVEFWMQSVRNGDPSPNYKFYLVGSKSDL